MSSRHYQTSNNTNIQISEISWNVLTSRKQLYCNGDESTQMQFEFKVGCWMNLAAFLNFLLYF